MAIDTAMLRGILTGVACLAGLATPCLGDAVSKTSSFYRISPSRSVYAIVSLDGLQLKTLKYQVSLKYQLFHISRRSGSLARNLNRLYVSYTMKAFWSLGEQGAPFEEIDHNPELFWEKWYDRSSQVQLLRLGIWEHESDGEEDAASASWDRQYLQVKLRPTDGEVTGNLDIKVWRLVDQNRPLQVLLPWNYLIPWVLDLKDLGASEQETTAAEHDADEDGQILNSLGRYEITPSITWWSGEAKDMPLRLQAATTFRRWPWPDRGGQRRGSIEGNLRWTVPGDVGDPILYLQLWRGYGERLRGYDDFRPLSRRFPFKVKGGFELKP